MSQKKDPRLSYTLRTQSQENLARIFLGGQINEQNWNGVYEAMITQIKASTAKNVEIDLSQLETADSSVLSLIMEVGRSFCAQEKTIKTIAMSPSLQSLVALYNLN